MIAQCFSRSAIAAAACLAIVGPVAAQDVRTPVLPELPAVRTLVVEPADAERSRRFFGRIEARESVDISFEVGGRLVALDPNEGARVPAGAILARLDAAPFERALARADLALEQATRDHARATMLAERDVGSRARAEDALTLRGLAEVALEDARAALAEATLVAPFDALVAARLTPAFENIDPGQGILRLHDMSEIRAVVALPERLVARVGDLAGLAFAAEPSDGGSPVPLRLVEFRPEADRIGQTYRVSLAFPKGTADPRLVPGASVTVVASLRGEADGGGARVPVSALLAGIDRGAALMVVEGEGEPVVRRRGVQVASRTGAALVVDLPHGTEIVAVGGHLLRDGQRIRRFGGLVIEER